VDPAVSYAKAAGLLAPGGSLVLLWNFTFLPADLQRELNEKVFAPHTVDRYVAMLLSFGHLAAAAEAERADIAARFGRCSRSGNRSARTHELRLLLHRARDRVAMSAWRR
jgi:hypothetical protein